MTKKPVKQATPHSALVTRRLKWEWDFIAGDESDE